ncbi:MAG TPA: response regulator [Methylomirabilota bacterium]|nr:response regulator [Methylomirabilota bacterium]
MARILVVDDEPDVANLVADVIRRDGFDVETVHSGAAALNRLAAEAYDLIVCDLVMPEVNGIAVYRAVHQLAEPRPLILFLSGYYDLFLSRHHDAGPYEAFLRETRQPALGKPFDINILRQTVRRLLEA